MGFWIFLAAVIAAVTFVFLFGRLEERTALFVLLVNFIATGLIYWLGNPDWIQPQVGIFLLDLLALIILAVMAFRSKRFWPMPVAAFQMIPVLTFFVTWVGEDLESYGIGLTQGVWSYPQLMIIIWAALRSKKRRQLEQGT
ncbi:hypothetical protein GCM10009096_04710 [Parasphingorhabdus litoris]|uniref:Uncharacterized protein n=1 Tax=Parasphingorhabdus litoris TaxID=394733 RepID=A0ABN1A419_9SPHN